MIETHIHKFVCAFINLSPFVSLSPPSFLSLVPSTPPPPPLLSPLTSSTFFLLLLLLLLLLSFSLLSLFLVSLLSPFPLPPSLLFFLLLFRYFQ